MYLGNHALANVKMKIDSSLFEIEIFAFGKQFVGLIDSGASHTYVSENIVAQVGSTFETCAPVQVMLPDGERLVTNKFVIANVKLGNQIEIQ